MRDSTENPAPFSWFTNITSKYSNHIFELTVIAIVLRLLGLVQPFVFQALIDRIIPFQREASLHIIIVIMIVVAIFSSALHSSATYLGSHFVNQLTREFSQKIYDHVLYLPLRTLQKWRVGDLFARMGEIETVRSFLTGTLSGITIDVIFSFVYIGALFLISPLLTLVIVIILPLQIIAFAIVGPFLRRRLKKSFEVNAFHQSRMIEVFNSVETIKSQTSEARHSQRLQVTQSDTMEYDFRITKLHIINGIIEDVSGNAFDILIVFLGALLVLRNEITLGELIAFHLLAGHVSGPLMSLASLWEEWQGIKIARLRLGDVLNAKSDIDAIKPALILHGSTHLSLSKVTFGYESEHLILQNINLNIQPGSPTLIVGGSGCGKSTLAKLMCGLYEPQSGKICANEQVLASVDPLSVRRQIAYMPQESALFAGTVRENLMLVKEDASEREIDAALTASASTEMIAQLPYGLDTDVGDQGSALSGGQRQRLGLARIFLAQPNVMILDEPTSALDERSATIVVQSLAQIATTHIVVIITHRPDLFGSNANIVNLEKMAEMSNDS